MVDWYSFALLSLAFYMFQGLLLKAAASRKSDRYLTAFYFQFTVALIALFSIFFLKGGVAITNIGLIAAVVNGIFFFLEISSRIESLKYIPASIGYPIVRMNIGFLVIILIIFFNETVTFENAVGILLSLAAIYLLSKGEAN